jgi:hypothetical protein
MRNNNRHKRVRLLVRKLNKARKKQAKQISILCHDLIDTQRDYNRRLSVIGLAAGFYKSILGINDLETLLNVASEHMVETTDTAQVVFVIRTENNYKSYVGGDSTLPAEPEIRLEQLFSPEVMDSICNSGKPCTMEDMLAMGLQIRPMDFPQVSAITVPLTDGACARGFMLLYQETGHPLSKIQIKQLMSLSGGLAKAITACEMLAGSA